MDRLPIRGDLIICEPGSDNLHVWTRDHTREQSYNPKKGVFLLSPMLVLDVEYVTPNHLSQITYVLCVDGQLGFIYMSETNISLVSLVPET